MRHLSFAYGDDRVLADLSFDVVPGRTVAVVGPTGSGKSTLASLLVRLVDPRTGEVLYDGTDARTFAPGAVPRWPPWRRRRRSCSTTPCTAT